MLFRYRSVRFTHILNDFILTDNKDSDTSKKKQVFQKYIDNLNKD